MESKAIGRILSVSVSTVYMIAIRKWTSAGLCPPSPPLFSRKRKKKNSVYVHWHMYLGKKDALRIHEHARTHSAHTSTTTNSRPIGTGEWPGPFFGRRRPFWRKNELRLIGVINILVIIVIVDVARHLRKDNPMRFGFFLSFRSEKEKATVEGKKKYISCFDIAGSCGSMRTVGSLQCHSASSFENVN